MDAEPGWYPDPDGSDRFRYFDGATWSGSTTDDPRRGPPTDAETDGSGGTGGAHRTGRWWLLGLVAVALVAILVAAVARPDDPSTATDPPATPQLGDASGSAPSPPTRPAVCTRGLPNQRPDHPHDARVHGGGLSYPRVAGFNAEAPEPRLTLAHDVTQQTRSVNPYPAWIAQLTLGRLASTDGWPTDPRQVAETALRCVAGSDLYALYDERLVVTESAPFSLDRDRSPRVEGPPVDGWRVGGRIDVDVPGLPFPGDQVVLVVVPADGGWSFFFGAAPVGDDGLSRVVDATVDALTATR